MERFIEWLIQKGGIQESQRTVVAYGLEEGFYSMTGILVALVLGIIMGIGWKGALFLIVLIPLRMSAGGYHASTRKRCAVLSLAIILTAYGFLRHWCFSVGGTLVLLLLFAVFITVTAPVETQNHRLDELEKKVYKKRTCRVLLIETTVALICMIIKQYEFVQIIAVNYITVSGLLTAGLVSNRM